MILLVAALAAAATLASFVLVHLLDPHYRLSGDALVLALILIAVVLLAGLICNWKGTAALRQWVPAIAAAVVLALGAAPYAIEPILQARYHARLLADDRQFEGRLLADIEVRRRDVETRAAQHRPYAPQEMLDLVNFVGGTDLRYRSLGDHSAAALALLRRALEAKLVDPNAMVRGPRPVDTADRPLFIQFYETRLGWRLRTSGAIRIGALDFAVLNLLVEHGANLSSPGAEHLIEDLHKTAAPEEDARFLRLR